MATERTVRPMAGFFKFQHIGALAAGKVESHRMTDNGPFFVLRPAVVRDERKGERVLYDSAAVALSTDIQLKSGKDDVGKYMLFEFNDTEPTAKGSPRKVFKVLELTEKEFAKYTETATDNSSKPYAKPEEATAADGDADADDDDDDELPF